jgi:hypothetical protein
MMTTVAANTLGGGGPLSLFLVITILLGYQVEWLDMSRLVGSVTLDLKKTLFLYFLWFEDLKGTVQRITGVESDINQKVFLSH